MLRFFAAFVLGKAAQAGCALLSRVSRRKGTTLPGAVAIRICPEFIARIPKPARIVAVTGTNGKTTTSNLLRDGLRRLGCSVLNNSAGGNINTGIATSLLHGVSLFGRVRQELAVLEVDERSARTVFPGLQPDLMIVTNLTRDSIMRNAHPEYIRDILTDYMPEKTKLILNADSLIAARVAPDNPRVYFGVGPMAGDKTVSTNRINDVCVCPRCHSVMTYEYLRYSDVGRVQCPGCGFATPDYDYAARQVDLPGGVFRFSGRGESMELPLIHASVFNLYNQVAAMTALMELGYSMEQAAEALKGVKINATRFDVLPVGDRKVVSIFCKDKNAYAVSRVLEYVLAQPGPKEILFYNNSVGDTTHWSENTCWLYDCDFELLRDETVRRVVVYGDRGRDLKLRLLLAGVPEERISRVDQPEQGIACLELPAADTVYVLYGSDSIDMGKALAERIAGHIRSHGGGRRV